MKITWTPKTGDGPSTAWTGTHLLVAHGRKAVLLKPDHEGTWNIVARASGTDPKLAAEQALENLTRPDPRSGKLKAASGQQPAATKNDQRTTSTE